MRIEERYGVIPTDIKLNSVYSAMLKDSLKRYEKKDLLKECTFIIIHNLISDESKRRRDSLLADKMSYYNNDNFLDYNNDLLCKKERQSPFSDSITMYPKTTYQAYIYDVITIEMRKVNSKDNFDKFCNGYNVYVDAFMLEYIYKKYEGKEGFNQIVDQILSTEIYDKLADVFSKDLDSQLGFNIIVSMMGDKRVADMITPLGVYNVLNLDPISLDNGVIRNSGWYNVDYVTTPETNILLNILGAFISSEINRQLLHKKVNNYHIAPATRFSNFIFSMMNSTTFWSTNSTALRIFADTFDVHDASFTLEMVKRFNLNEKLAMNNRVLPGTDINSIKEVLNRVVSSAVVSYDTMNNKNSNDGSVAGVKVSPSYDGRSGLIQESCVPMHRLLINESFSSSYINAKAFLVCEAFGEEFDEYYEELFGVKLMQSETEKLRELSRKVDALRIQANTITNKYEQERASSFGHDIYAIIEGYEMEDKTTTSFKKTLSGLKGDLDDIMTTIRKVNLEKKRFNIYIPSPKGYEG